MCQGAARVLATTASSCHQHSSTAVPGSAAVTGASTLRVQVWDCKAQQHLFTLGRHTGSIMDLAADGQLVASTCGKELKLWDLGSRKCISTRPHNSPIDLAGQCTGSGLVLLEAAAAMHSWQAPGVAHSGL